MENLEIEKTSRTPFVFLNAEAGTVKISGTSQIENTEQFFTPIIDWIEEYVKTPKEQTVVNFEMEYYNTSSQMWIFQIFKAFTDLQKVGKDVVFNWCYSDIDIKESGEDLANLLNISINLIEIEAN